jgi:nucleotide-binding universal stress UspA family protein
MSVLAEVPLHVVHAWKVPMALQMSEGRISEERYRTEEIGLAEAALRGMQQDLAGVATHGPPVFHEGCGNASGVILDKTVELEASLLVMGTLGRSGIAGLFVGNTAEKILDQAPCSLLTVKPRDFEVPPEEECRDTTQMRQTPGVDPDPETASDPALEIGSAADAATDAATDAPAGSPPTDTTDSDE